MARTTSAEVEAIIEVDVSIPLDPFIAVANSLVNQLVAEESDAPDEARLTLIETWLAAHFYCMRDPRVTMEKAGPVQANYQSAVDLYLATSHYGQMAMTLDTTGFLRALSNNKNRKTGVFWLGKTQAEIEREV